MVFLVGWDTKFNPYHTENAEKQALILNPTLFYTLMVASVQSVLSISIATSPETVTCLAGLSEEPPVSMCSS